MGQKGVDELTHLPPSQGEHVDGLGALACRSGGAHVAQAGLGIRCLKSCAVTKETARTRRAPRKPEVASALCPGVSAEHPEPRSPKRLDSGQRGW